MALGFIALVAVVLAADRAADHAVDLLKRSHARELEVNEATRGVLRVIVDLEADEQEFLLTGASAFAERWEANRALLPGELATLKDAVKNDPVSTDLVERLDALVARWIEDVAKPAMAARRNAGTGPVALAKPSDSATYPGESIVQTSRTLSRQLRAQIHTESMEAEAHGTEQRRRTRRFIGVVAIVFGLFIFLGGARAARRLGRDITRLTHHADSLAAGNFAGESAPVYSTLLGRIDHGLGGAAKALAWRETAFRLLLGASRETSAAPSRAEVATVVQAAIGEILPEPRVALVWLDGERCRVSAIAPRPPEMTAAWFEWTPIPEGSVLTEIRRTRASVVSLDPAQGRFPEDARVLASGGATWCAVPVMIGQRVAGAMTVALTRGAFDDGHVRFLETLAQQIGQQLEATELRESLAERNEELRRATQAKSGFLAMMSHELRTPLNSVIGFSEVLADQKFGPLNDKQARFIQNVLESGRHLLRLINDLLDLSKIEAGRMEVGRQPCSVRALAEQVVTSLQPLAAARNLTVTLGEEPQPSVWADAMRMKQVLYNFLSNALKFAPEGGNIHVGFTHDASTVRVSVRDDGPGISIEDQARLFQPFNQLKSVTPAGSSLAGTGLGLALARQFAMLMHGSVGVDSQLGKGATFWVEMPRTDAPEDDAPRDEHSNLDQPLALVVDDDAAARELVKLALQGAGYRVVEARTGEDALAQARRLQPTVITLDVFLPGIDGWQVLEELGTDPRTRGIRVIVLTVSNERQKALQLGAQEHLVKPIDRELLRRAVAEPQTTKRRRVLLVESQAEVRSALQRELQRRLLEVHPVDSVAQALRDLTGRDHFDLVLLGQTSADLPRIDVTTAIRATARGAELPVVMIASRLLPSENARLREHVQAILDHDALPADEATVKVGAVVAGLIRRAKR